MNILPILTGTSVTVTVNILPILTGTSVTVTVNILPILADTSVKHCYLIVFPCYLAVPFQEFFKEQ